MRPVQNFLSIDSSIYSPKEHRIQLPDAQFVPTCSTFLGSILWLFGQAVSLQIKEKDSLRTVYVRKSQVLEFLKKNRSETHIGRQFAEKIYSLIQGRPQGFISKSIQTVRNEANRTGLLIQGISLEELRQDLKWYLDTLLSTTEKLLLDQTDPELVSNIVDAAKHELGFLALEVKDLKKTEACHQVLPPLSQEAKAWHEKMFSSLHSASLPLDSIREALEDGKKKNFLNTKAVTHLGGTLLHTIAKRERGDPELIPFVLALGAEASLQDFWGNTPLMWAIANASNGNALALLRASEWGATHLNLQDFLHENTALHLAIAKGYTTFSSTRERLACPNSELVSHLINKGANLNIQNALGDTPLHLACARRDSTSIRALLRAGADSSIRNKAGKRPEELLILPYHEAKALMEKTATFFLLERSEFEAHLPEARALFLRT